MLEVAVDSLRFYDNVTVLVLSVASVFCVVDEVRSSKTVMELLSEDTKPDGVD